MDTERYLHRFEEAIKIQAESVGADQAREQAKKAGLGISPDGRVVSCVGHPTVILLRLLKMFTSDGNLNALAACSSLMDELASIVDKTPENETVESK